jgi:hypothetical protein
MSDLKEFNVLVDVSYQAEFRVVANSQEEALALTDDDLYYPDICIGLGDAEMVEATVSAKRIEE